MAAMEESSPPMVAGSGKISVFLDLRRLPSRDALEAFIYGVFRSREPLEFLLDGCDAPKGKRGQVARPGGGARHSLSFLLRDSVCVISKLRIVIFWKIFILEKSPVNLSPYRSLKLKNTQNMVFLSCRVITKIMVILWEIPQNN